MIFFKKWTLLITLFLSQNTIIFSQISNPLDEKYTQPSNSFFGSKKTSSQKNNDNSQHIDMPKNFVLSAASDLLKSQININYEREIVNGFYILGGLGIPFGINMIENGIEKFTNVFYDEEDSKYSYSLMLNNSKFNSGVVMSSGLKYYFDDYDNELLKYFSFNYKYTRNNFEIDPTKDTQHNFRSSELEWKKISHFFVLTRGTKWIIGKSKYKFVNDINIGFGLKLTKFDTYSTIYINSNVPSSCTKDNILDTRKVVYFCLNYSLGIGW